MSELKKLWNKRMRIYHKTQVQGSFIDEFLLPMRLETIKTIDRTINNWKVNK